MNSVVKHILSISALVLMFGCSGGGCSSCSGVTPLASGFTSEKRIENAGSVRITDTGIDFLEKNIGTLAKTMTGNTTGIMTFEVPSSSGSSLGLDYTICPDGPDSSADPPSCTAEVDLDNLEVSILPDEPRDIKISGSIPVRIQDLPIVINYWGIDDGTATVVLNDNGGCPGDTQTFASIPVYIDLSIEVDGNQTHVRAGYSKIGVEDLSSSESALQDALNYCDGTFTSTVLDIFEPILISTLYDGLLSTLTSTLEEQLCQKANTELDPACPTGSNNVDGICRYGSSADSTCVSVMLGTDGHADLGSLMSSFSPGTTGGLDFLFAAGGPSTRDDGSDLAWGDVNPVGSGATLGFLGGAEASPISGCVPLSEFELPTGVPIPDELVANTVTNWPTDMDGPHVGIAISERFLNYAFNSIYASGLLCLGVTSDISSMLNSSTIGLAVGSSLKDLGLQQESQPVAIVVRPGKAPQVVFGNGTDIATDPLIRLTLEQASFDFYIWSTDRFIRFMTATFDLDVPMNLTVTPEGLTPVLEDIGVNNPIVSNSSLLREDPEDIAAALADLLASQVGSALGEGLPSFDLNSAISSYGLSLSIPDTVEGQGSAGLRKLTKNSDNFLGIFATLEATEPVEAISDTQMEFLSKDVTREGLSLGSMTRENRPTVHLKLGSSLDDGQRTIEYSYRVDGGFWHPFKRERFLSIQDPALRLAGVHKIAVRSRIVGEPMSLDPTPAEIEVGIDIDPPTVAFGKMDGNELPLRIKDNVDTSELLLVRYQLDNSAWTPWMLSTDVSVVNTKNAKHITVEVKDFEENVGVARQALIRGGSVGDSDSSSSCAMSNSKKNSWGWLLFPLVIFAARHRRQSGFRAPSSRSASRFKLGIIPLVIFIPGLWMGCSCGNDSTTPAEDYACVDPCITLEPGLVGEYSSVASKNGHVWMAGYAEANWNVGYSWGDLVVGEWTETAGITWELIDGVPTEPEPDGAAFDLNGFRGGQTESGDDVGLWTSIAIDSAGNPAIAYYDRTNMAVKFAQRIDGAWKTHTIEQRLGADLGRYAKLIFVDDIPIVAYLDIEGTGNTGYIASFLRVATGTSNTPGSVNEWNIEDAVIDLETPCRAAYCPTGTVCVADTGLCTTPLSDESCSTCDTGTECIDVSGVPTCSTVYDANKVDSYPEAIADYISLDTDPEKSLAIAYYDRIRGKLMVTSNATGAWVSTEVDGGVTADVGMSASLDIDSSGYWHLSYVDGTAEAVRYIMLDPTMVASTSEIVDDGYSVGGVTFEDGQHMVGDDSNIYVTPAGQVYISYQDATVGTLRLAIGTPQSDGTHTWETRLLEQSGFAGAFSHLFDVDGQLYVSNFWRVGGEEVLGDITVLTP